MKSSDLSENASFVLYCQLAVLVLAALVTYSTGCLTCRLAGCLALAAAAFLHAVLQYACAQCLYVFHLYVLLHFLVYKILQIISYVARLCKYFNLWRHICPPWFIWIEQECTQVFYHGKISYPDSAPFCPLLLRGNCYLSASARVWDVPFSVG